MPNLPSRRRGARPVSAEGEDTKACDIVVDSSNSEPLDSPQTLSTSSESASDGALAGERVTSDETVETSAHSTQAHISPETTASRPVRHPEHMYVGRGRGRGRGGPRGGLGTHPRTMVTHKDTATVGNSHMPSNPNDSITTSHARQPPTGPRHDRGVGYVMQEPRNFRGRGAFRGSTRGQGRDGWVGPQRAISRERQQGTRWGHRGFEELNGSLEKMSIEDEAKVDRAVVESALIDPAEQPKAIVNLPSVPSASPSQAQPLQRRSQQDEVRHVAIQLKMPNMTEPRIVTVPYRRYLDIPRHRKQLKFDMAVRVALPGSRQAFVYPTPESAQAAGAGLRAKPVKQENGRVEAPLITPEPEDAPKIIVRLPSSLQPRRDRDVPPAAYAKSDAPSPESVKSIPTKAHSVSSSTASPVQVHQPRPTKAVNVADIETETQTPAAPTRTSAELPDTAVFAPPFQPTYSSPPAYGYYGPAAMTRGFSGVSYASSSFAPGQAFSPTVSTAQESNGMVYYNNYYNDPVVAAVAAAPYYPQQQTSAYGYGYSTGSAPVWTGPGPAPPMEMSGSGAGMMGMGGAGGAYYGGFMVPQQPVYYA
ncbi:hypothetical protein SAICODRAFT_29166 [Saitoella complicata NRRL Y-17804]|uniref:uncharacterized protein n=1 Tax=Saitoella complicata (strain BCRC 22490 / CBS 7301 / JCM 7358 / NBRC 10748 / NRRL Y-17804) TaxID=698492 RepID=UPI0008680969|nr:uncharacterized protein SAICODRAFT_29166 [Saitoella complicata NRRL Y-17804]ODQ54951.1 hypothetical protein SAICODRAFT_29166 [Saitoella complicata NRRL Y-17804]